MFGAKRRNYTDSAYLIVGKKKWNCLWVFYILLQWWSMFCLTSLRPTTNTALSNHVLSSAKQSEGPRNAKHPALQRWLAFKRFGNANFGIAELEPIGLAMPWIPKLGASLSIEEGFATLRSATDCHIWDISVICLIIWECLSRLPRGALELLWKRA